MATNKYNQWGKCEHLWVRRKQCSLLLDFFFVCSHLDYTDNFASMMFPSVVLGSCLLQNWHCTCLMELITWLEPWKIINESVGMFEGNCYALFIPDYSVWQHSLPKVGCMGQKTDIPGYCKQNTEHSFLWVTACLRRSFRINKKRRKVTMRTVKWKSEEN